MWSACCPLSTSASWNIYCCCWVTKSCLTLCDLQHARLQHTRLPCPSLSPRVCSGSCPLSQWCYLSISSSAALFFCLQSFPASGSFPMSWVFTSGGQNIGVSASASVLPGNIQGWFPLGLTSSISSKPKGLSRVFSSTTIWKHQFFGAQPSSWSNSPIYTWLLEKPQLWLCKLLLAKCCLCFLICFVIAFLPRSKRLWISRLQSPLAVNLKPPE